MFPTSVSISTYIINFIQAYCIFWKVWKIHTSHMIIISCYCCWVTQSCLTHTQVCPYTAVHQASSSFTVSQRLLKLMSIESVMLSNHRMLCLPLLLLSSIFPSIRGFSNESAFPIRWPEYWGFSFSISPSNEYSESISFRIDWFDLLAAQRTLKNLLQHHSSKALSKIIFNIISIY